MAVTYYAARPLNVGAENGMELRDTGDEIPEAHEWPESALVAAISNNEVVAVHTDYGESLKDKYPHLIHQEIKAVEKNKEEKHEKAESDLFDPTEYNVQDVVDYINSNPDDVERVLGLEEASDKPRTTLVKALEAELNRFTEPTE